ncbi:MAG: HEAT repeat domain-containing protein [Methanotrichaceae archaeon]
MISNPIFSLILAALLITPALAQDNPTNANIDNYIQQLKHNDTSKVKIMAIQALTSSNDSRATDSLIQALAYKDNDIRIEAVGALGKRDDPKAINPLIQALGDDNSDIHAAAIEALAEIGAPAIEPLIQALQDGNSLIRRGAAAALGEIGDSKAKKPLLQVLSNDKDRNVQLSAARALKKIGEEGHSFTIVKNSIIWGGGIQLAEED